MRAEFITKRMSFCGWTGEKYKNHFGDGIYVCSQCGYELFNSITKFKHDSPWPAFTETMHTDSVSKREESPRALKVSCGKCGNGLGHEFLGDGPDGKSRF
ncbi:methionine-R-sulfoxide reductase B1-A-like [Corticium candelabrum]|uniref:methionine-R-sulfoxide reductase B1-A-like n=1 Tax=Corticium candelabrum TaxID=121492 RepID=UPI002E370DA5|nr:methionine-R-sulfoxide reductase B1-A-like [Corticium candelabrum]